MPIFIGAFQLDGRNTLHNAQTGSILKENWEGYCQVFFSDKLPLIFKTGIESGERYWQAEGNNPKKSYHFING